MNEQISGQAVVFYSSNGMVGAGIESSSGGTYEYGSTRKEAFERLRTKIEKRSADTKAGKWLGDSTSQYMKECDEENR